MQLELRIFQVQVVPSDGGSQLGCNARDERAVQQAMPQYPSV